ncbi:hypothetical protein D3C72_2314840 [compost metagenome]
MHVQGDPGGDVVEAEPGFFGLGAFEYHGQAFLLAEAADNLQVCRQLAVAQGAEHVFAGIELRAHAAQQRCQ